MKKKHIIAGIYLKSEPSRLVGLAEMFDYRKRSGNMTIGYRLNESYWHRGIASGAIALMKDYLLNEQGLSALFAFVMPENIYSARALIKNGFVKQSYQEEKESWAGMHAVDTDVYVCSAQR